MSMAPAFDFCAFQRFVNNAGGNEHFPSFQLPEAGHEGDRLEQYGLTWEQYCEDEAYPDRPGVYSISVLQLGFNGEFFRAVGYEHLLYIGSSKSIRARLKTGHPWHEKVHERFHGLDQAVIVRYRISEDYLWMERSLIRTLRPLLNIKHNG